MTTEDVSEEDLGKHLDQVLRSALGNNVEDLNIGKIHPISKAKSIYLPSPAISMRFKWKMK